MVQKVRVAVIGGGIVGCGLLYRLAKLGWTDSILLEKNELTSGSTWHAAGNVTFFGHYPSITQLYVNSVKTYLEAEQETGQSLQFHGAGSLRIANNEYELAYYKSLQPAYDKMQVEYAVVDRDRISELHPLLNPDKILGAAYTPTDGHLDPSGATHAMAKGARKLGAQIKRNCAVERLEQSNGGWLLHTDTETIEAQHVVMANSFWTRELAQPLGLNIPVFAVKHQAISTEDIEVIKQLDFELPTVRDSYGQYNMRQEGFGIHGAVYEPDPEFWAIDGIPPDFNQELFEPDMTRIERDYDKVLERLPVIGEAGIKSFVHGPICYTPDALPLLGPVQSHPGLWLATGYCIGIGTGGGSADYLANWMIQGAPPYPLPMVYPSRFGNDLEVADCLDSITKIYQKGYRLES